MSSSSLLVTVCLGGLLAGCGSAVAQGLDAAWLAGKWQGELTTATNRGGPGPEIVVKDDGTFDGGVRRPEGFTAYRDGKWKIAEDTVTFEYHVDVVTSSGRVISKVTWTLKRKGKDLEGTALREVDAAEASMTLKRAK